MDELSASTTSPPQVGKLTTYARGQFVQNWTATLLQRYGRGEHQVGTTKVELMSNEAGETATQRRVTVCLDTSGVQVLDKDGKSLKSPSATNRSTAVHLVEQDLRDGAWYVTTYEGKQGC